MNLAKSIKKSVIKYCLTDCFREFMRCFTINRRKIRLFRCQNFDIYVLIKTLSVVQLREEVGG